MVNGPNSRKDTDFRGHTSENSADEFFIVSGMMMRKRQREEGDPIHEEPLNHHEAKHSRKYVVVNSSGEEICSLASLQFYLLAKELFANSSEDFNLFLSNTIAEIRLGSKLSALDILRNCHGCWSPKSNQEQPTSQALSLVDCVEAFYPSAEHFSEHKQDQSLQISQMQACLSPNSRSTDTEEGLLDSAPCSPPQLPSWEEAAFVHGMGDTLCFFDGDAWSGAEEDTYVLSS